VSLEKLWFLQKRHAARYASLQPPKPSNPSHDLEELAVKPILKFLDNSASHQPDRFPFYNALPEGEARFNFVRSIVWADAQNYTDPEEFISRNNYFFVSPTAEELASNAHHIKLHNVPSDLTHTIPSSSFLLFFQNIGEIPEQDWNKAVLKSWITSIVDQGSMMSIGELRKEEKGSEELEALVKKAWAKLVHGYIRWAIMAGRPGPDGSEIMRILGRQECLRRLDAAGKVLLAREEEESVVAKDGVEAGL
jgi:glutamyl-tRNA synthetase